LEREGEEMERRIRTAIKEVEKGIDKKERKKRGWWDSECEGKKRH